MSSPSSYTMESPIESISKLSFRLTSQIRPKALTELVAVRYSTVRLYRTKTNIYYAELSRSPHRKRISLSFQYWIVDLLNCFVLFGAITEEDAKKHIEVVENMKTKYDLQDSIQQLQDVMKANELKEDEVKVFDKVIARLSEQEKAIKD